MRVSVIDTETTGFEPEENSVVEIAEVDLDTGDFRQSLVQNEHPIGYGAMATHMITPEMTASKTGLHETIEQWPMRTADVLAAHNAQFDRGFLLGYGLQDVSWICTWKCAMRLMPEAESHKNLALCFEAGLDITDYPRISNPDDPHADAPHRALFDAWATRKLLDHLLDIEYDRVVQSEHFDGTSPTRDQLIENLVQISSQPVLLRKVSFGKHSGELWEDVPISYMYWVESQDFDEDVKYTVDHWLKVRGARR